MCCDSLESIEVDSANENYKSVDGNLYTKDGTVLMKYGINKPAQSFTVPDGVTAVKKGAFKGNRQLRGITLPEGVTEIGEEAFYGCISLESVSVPESVTSIDRTSFAGCGKLWQVEDGVYYVGNWAVEFKNTTDVTSVTVRDGTVGIGSVMKGHYLRTIDLPDSVKYISGAAFHQCVNLKNITIPDGVEEILVGTFSGCYALTEIVIPASIKRIEVRAFEDCRLTSVTFENSDGWKYNYNDYWRVIEEDLSDTSVAATALKSTYLNHALKIDE
jgi:hypothetical protein